jgi:ABC-2 type transport system permease protein
MNQLIAIEIQKILRKNRSYISIIAVIVLVSLVQLGMWYAGKFELDFITRSFQNSFYFEGNLMNTYFVANVILNTLWIHMPILIVLVTGDLIAGEANSGTFRLILIRPVSRFKLLTAKFLTGICFSSFLVILLAFLSLGVGRIIFGKGDLIVIHNTINVFPENDIAWRFLCAYSFSLLSMATIVSLSLFLSSFANNSIGPIIITIVIIIVFNIISNIDITLFRVIKPYLFTNYLNSWNNFFDYDINHSQIQKSLLILTGHIIGFFLITVYYFRRKDILS